MPNYSATRVSLHEELSYAKKKNSTAERQSYIVAHSNSRLLKKCSLGKVLELGYLVTYLVTTMIHPFSQARILGAVVLLLVFGSLVLATIDPSTRPTFGDLTEVVVGAYIGLYIPAPNKRR